MTPQLFINYKLKSVGKYKEVYWYENIFFDDKYASILAPLYAILKIKNNFTAHLPWRMMTYKALNTFIDDIFAFVIKMPTMYRIGCFRDDIVFFIFLYQKYVYRVSLQIV